MDDNKLKQYYNLFTDIWKLFRKYSSPDGTSEFWASYKADVAELDDKYQKSDLFRALVLAATREILRIEKRGCTRHG